MILFGYSKQTCVYLYMEKFEITVDYENQVTIIKHVESGTETKVSLSFTLIDCIKLVMSK